MWVRCTDDLVAKRLAVLWLHFRLHIHITEDAVYANIIARDYKTALDRAGLRHWGAPFQRVMGALPFPLRPFPLRFPSPSSRPVSSALSLPSSPLEVAT